MLRYVDSGAPLDTDIAIETPEHIVFRHRVAGPARRLLAYLLDLAICYGAFAAVAIVVLVITLGVSGASATTDSLGAGVGLLLVLAFAIQWVYFAVLESWRGTTPGKAALGLRVLTTTGRPIGFREAALRNVLRAADALPLPSSAGGLSMAGLASLAVTKHFQRLGDLAAATIVVMPNRATKTVPLVLWPPAQPQELARLSDFVRLDADERQAIELFLRRRKQLGPAREFELANMIAAALGARFGLPPGDPSRTLALVYDRAANAGRQGDAPPSSGTPGSWS